MALWRRRRKNRLWKWQSMKVDGFLRETQRKNWEVYEEKATCVMRETTGKPSTENVLCQSLGQSIELLLILRQLLRNTNKKLRNCLSKISSKLETFRNCPWINIKFHPVYFPSQLFQLKLQTAWKTLPSPKVPEPSANSSQFSSLSQPVELHSITTVDNLHVSDAQRDDETTRKIVAKSFRPVQCPQAARKCPRIIEVSARDTKGLAFHLTFSIVWWKMMQINFSRASNDSPFPHERALVIKIVVMERAMV